MRYCVIFFTAYRFNGDEMSIIYCEKHDRKWDSDSLSECPLCENEPEEITHGIDCRKVDHLLTQGALHGADDDTPYDVDGQNYCGRCHSWIGEL